MFKFGMYYYPKIHTYIHTIMSNIFLHNDTDRLIKS